MTPLKPPAAVMTKGGRPPWNPPPPRGDDPTSPDNAAGGDPPDRIASDIVCRQENPLTTAPTLASDFRLPTSDSEPPTSDLQTDGATSGIGNVS
jgi:hypothetical protein